VLVGRVRLAYVVQKLLRVGFIPTRRMGLPPPKPKPRRRPAVCFETAHGLAGSAQVARPAPGLKGVAVQAYPVSVKGVVARDGRILLLHNERGEWELPGGRLEIGESPEQCVAREIAEETGWAVTAGPILDAWLYYIDQAAKHVLIVTYACQLNPGQEILDPVLSDEHQRIGLFTPEETARLVMPRGYKDSIATWLTQHAPAAG
jgi:ADP-ribose pyrophosphatase YjhB (NUDIX family)